MKMKINEIKINRVIEVNKTKYFDSVPSSGMFSISIIDICTVKRKHSIAPELE